MSQGKDKRPTSSVNPLVDALVKSAMRSDVPKGSLKDLPIMVDGMTTEELALAANRGVETIRERLKGLLAQGELIVGRKETRNLLGQKQWVPCYKFVETK